MNGYKDATERVHVHPHSGFGTKKDKHRKERDSMSAWKISSQIFILIMFSDICRHRRPSPSSSSPIDRLNYLVIPAFTRMSVVCGGAEGSAPVSPVSPTLKVLCSNWQTGSVLSLPLGGEEEPQYRWIRHL